jgi:hypothetical protein
MLIIKKPVTIYRNGFLIKIEESIMPQLRMEV